VYEVDSNLTLTHFVWGLLNELIMGVRLLGIKTCL